MNAPNDFRAMTTETIGKDLLSALVTEIKLLPKPWAKLSEADEIDTALVFGTLKALPGGLPDSMQAHWIDGGVVGQMREAA